MRILAITCLCGDEKLVAMAEGMLVSLRACVPLGVEMRIAATSQGAVRPVDRSLVDFEVVTPENHGFAAGMNAAIEAGIDSFEPDRILCLNTDLQFPDRNWLAALLAVADHKRITCPATDRTALYKQNGVRNKESFVEQEASAYCWLVPFSWCKHLKETYGWWLFDPAFFAFGEDNKTAFLLSKWFGPKIFRMVPRSFVRHIRHQTTSVVKPDRRASSRLLKAFFQGELKIPGLRPDLRAWAQRYVTLLRT